MASDLLSLADASQLLGVSVERVRQLVVAGDLPGVRFGNAWAVPRDAVAARGQVSNRRGRPLGEKRAWEAISECDVDLSNVGRYRNRGEQRRYSMSLAAAAHLVDVSGAVQSGVAAAVSYGEPLSADGAEVDLYVPEELAERLASIVRPAPSWSCARPPTLSGANTSITASPVDTGALHPPGWGHPGRNQLTRVLDGSAPGPPAPPSDQ